MGYLELIKTNAVKPHKILEYVDITQAVNKNLSRNLDDLLTFIKLENTNKSSIDKPTDRNLLAFVTQEIKKFEYACVTKNISIYLETNIHPDYSLNLDYSKLEKVLNNLVVNAIKFSKVGKEIHIHFTMNEDGINLVVQDQGEGIALESQDNIFRRFYQAENNTNSSGFGIGLFLVKNIITSWNGSISIESALGEGARFTIHIPIPSDVLVGAYSATQELVYFEEEETTLVENTVLKILVVEDQLEMINYLSHIFAVNYYCDFAYNGKEALDRIQKNKYALIVSDYKMPVMDGIELKTILDKNPDTAAIPFILNSASPIEDKLAVFEQNKFFRFIKKPFTNRDLTAAINHFIGYKINENKLIHTEKETVDIKDKEVSSFLEAVNAYILANLDNDKLRVDDIARQIGYSKKHFVTMLNDCTNLNPSKIILEIRMLKAYEFFKIAKYQSIGEVMYAVGILSRPYFTKVFKKRFGMNPGEMLRDNSKKVKY